MTTAHLAGTPRTPLVRSAVLPSLAMGAGSGLVGLVTAGGPGLWGAALGTLLAVGFFWFGQVVLGVVRSVTPGLFFVVALLTYILQIVALLAVFASFRRNDDWSDAVSATALGTTIIACTAVWTVGLVVASTRERIPLYDVDGGTR